MCVCVCVSAHILIMHTLAGVAVAVAALNPHRIIDGRLRAPMDGARKEFLRVGLQIGDRKNITKTKKNNKKICV